MRSAKDHKGGEPHGDTVFDAVQISSTMSTTFNEGSVGWNSSLCFFFSCLNYESTTGPVCTSWVSEASPRTIWVYL